MPSEAPSIYFHCAKCLQENNRPKISAGLASDGNLLVWCEHHQIPIGKFTLLEPFDMSRTRCAECGEVHDEKAQ